jgi:hypothetical protein
MHHLVNILYIYRLLTRSAVIVPGSPSPEGRKPGTSIVTRKLVTREGLEGSNPSPGASGRIDA